MSKGGKTTTVQNADPWAGIQPYLTGGIGGEAGIYPEAQRVYQQGPQTYFPGNTVANPFNEMTRNGMGLAERLAGNSTGLATNAAAVLGRVSNPTEYGVREISAPSMGITPHIGGARVNVDLPSSRPNVEQILGMGYENPYLQNQITGASRDVIRGFNEQTMPAIRGEAQAAGGYGGSRQGIAEGIASRGLQDTLGDISSGMRSNAYNQAFGAMSGLTGQLAGQEANAGALNAQLEQARNIRNAELQQQGNLFNAQQSMDAARANQARDVNLADIGQREEGISLTAAGMAPSIMNMAYQGSDVLRNLGGMQTAYDQSKINEEMERYRFNQDAPWVNLNRYAGIIQPGSGIGQSQSQTTKNNPGALETIGTLGQTGASIYMMMAL